jgi:hypothetical protein
MLTRIDSDVKRFNSLGEFDPYEIVLCNPGAVYSVNHPISNVIGLLRGYEADEIVFNFNSPDELNFRLNRTLSVVNTSSLCIDTPGGNMCILPTFEDNELKRIYDLVETRELLFVTDVGFFEINSVESHSENGLCYKDVKASSIESELRHKTIPFFTDDTYPLQTTQPGSAGRIETGILNIIVDRFPLWSIGYVDSSIASRYRTFKDVDVSTDCLSFLIDDVQKSYNCIIEFDTVRRQIRAYDRTTYPERKHTDIIVSNADLIGSMNITENADSYYTAMRVTGYEDLTISSVNPLGGNTIYNFDYFIPRFSSQLAARVASWKTAIDDCQANYSHMCSLRDEYSISRTDYRLERERRAVLINVYTTLYNNIQSAYTAQNDDLVRELIDTANTCIQDNDDGEEIDIDADIADVLDAIQEIIDSHQGWYNYYDSGVQFYDSRIAYYEDEIEATIDSLSLPVYFGDLYNELRHYIFEGEYNNEFISVIDTMSVNEKQVQRQALYEDGRLYLSNKCSPKQEFDLSIDNLIMSSEFEHMAQQLDAGCLINVEIEPSYRSLFDGNLFAELVVLTIEINFDDHVMTLRVGNKYERNNPDALFSEIFNNN